MVVPDAMVPYGAKASVTAMLIFGGWHLAGAVAGVVPITKCSRRVSAGPRIFAIVGLVCWTVLEMGSPMPPTFCFFFGRLIQSVNTRIM